eukprot:CAMPEP_0196652002 /NCGR_PEP_ID=MMETSP1086-20130531/1197_1 /TAXON_ID=77921 /ORGANISM="Cyanoptyche  gloeocystis , Strain SAG4.97" /LENGTH=214 /DNA_ID=CAMNT_0041982333 /DNA_START=31 /DNA_END=675 /DNA_ORIENTATION=+
MSFNPYTNNGGTTVAIGGPDYCVVGADTRLSSGYSILSRDTSKLSQLTSKTILASAGMRADQLALHKTLKLRLQKYMQQHGKEMSTPAFAQFLSNTLYYKRFFPYYTFNLVAGLDEQGEGVVYTYDAIGSFERYKYGASGTGQQLIQPVIDNQVNFNNQPEEKKRPLTLDEALDLLKDCFTCAGERDIYTGDFVDIAIITKEGIRYEKFELKMD